MRDVRVTVTHEHERGKEVVARNKTMLRKVVEQAVR
jgi:hypothetical protein